MAGAAKSDKGALLASPSPFLPATQPSLLLLLPSIHPSLLLFRFFPPKHRPDPHRAGLFGQQWAGPDHGTFPSIHRGRGQEAQGPFFSLSTHLPFRPTHPPFHLSTHAQVTVLLAECSDAVLRNLEASDLLKDVGGDSARACLEDVVEEILKGNEQSKQAGWICMTALSNPRTTSKFTLFPLSHSLTRRRRAFACRRRRLKKTAGEKKKKGGGGG